MEEMASMPMGVGIELIGTPNESNDPYCGHLKMIWTRRVHGKESLDDMVTNGKASITHKALVKHRKSKQALDGSLRMKDTAGSPKPQLQAHHWSSKNDIFWKFVSHLYNHQRSRMPKVNMNKCF